MKYEHGNGARRVTREILRAFDRRDRGDHARQFAAETERHHCAVGNSGDEDALAINRIAVSERVNQGSDKSHVVDIILLRISATVAGVPGWDVAQTTSSARIDGDES